MFWPDADDEAARGALRRTLSALRTAVGERGLRIDRTRVGVDPDAAWVDLADVERLAGIQRARRSRSRGWSRPRSVPRRVQPSRQSSLRRLARGAGEPGRADGRRASRATGGCSPRRGRHQWRRRGLAPKGRARSARRGRSAPVDRDPRADRRSSWCDRPVPRACRPVGPRAGRPAPPRDDGPVRRGQGGDVRAEGGTFCRSRRQTCRSTSRVPPKASIGGACGGVTGRASPPASRGARPRAPRSR